MVTNEKLIWPQATVPFQFDASISKHLFWYQRFDNATCMYVSDLIEKLQIFVHECMCIT